MKNLGSTRSVRVHRQLIDSDLGSERPLRVPGATVAASTDSPDLDLDSLASRPAAGASVASTGSANPDRDSTADRAGQRAVLLSDGTRITFKTKNGSDSEQ